VAAPGSGALIGGAAGAVVGNIYGQNQEKKYADVEFGG
jgi:outer membrane lipoprotein SlyB